MRTLLCVRIGVDDDGGRLLVGKWKEIGGKYTEKRSDIP
jgi:hypothetical protein